MVICMPILEKIISGGQTGADRAALDTAIKFNIPHGGWITKGRRTEEGVLPEKYRLKEMPTADYPSRTRQNILDSGGTVIVSRGPLTGGSKLTHSFANVSGKPVCHIDLLNNDIFEAALILHSFLLENYILVLNVAGPRASGSPSIYFDVKSVIESTLYLMFLDKETVMGPVIDMPKMAQTQEEQPKDLGQAVEWITADLSLRAKTKIGRMEDGELRDLYFTLMDYIKLRTCLDKENNLLLERLAKKRGKLEFTAEDAVMEIVRALKQHMAKHYRLRIVT